MCTKFSTLLYSCVPTLPCKLPHAKHVKCNQFYSVDCGWLPKEPVFVVRWLWKEPVAYSRCSKWCPFAFTHAHSRALHWSTALSTMLCGMLPRVSMTRCFKSLMSRGYVVVKMSRLSATCLDYTVLQPVTCKTRHFCHLTSEQNKVSKSEVVKKVIPDF